jgi:hypothetical protein
VLPSNYSTPLLCRIPLFADESLPSYLHRVTTANGYDYSTFTSICRDRLSAKQVRDNLERPRHPETFDVLSSLTGVEPKALANASISRFLQTVLLSELGKNIRLSDGSTYGILEWWIRSRYFHKDHFAHFCPACLRDALYHRSIWIPLDVTACLNHACLLVDHCGFCNELVSVQDIVGGRCNQCGENLENTPSRSIRDKPFELFVQGTLQAWWGVPHQAISTAWSLPVQPISILYRVFEGFKNCLIDKQQVEQHLELTEALLDQHEICVAAFGCLINWPQGFCDLLKIYLKRKQIKGICYHPYFSHPGALISARLFGLWTQGEYEFVQEAFDEFILENPDLFETKIWRQRIETRPGFAEKFPYISKFGASQMLDVPLLYFDFATSLQRIVTHNHQVGQDVWVRREDVLKFQETCAEKI